MRTLLGAEETVWNSKPTLRYERGSQEHSVQANTCKYASRPALESEKVLKYLEHPRVSSTTSTSTASLPSTFARRPMMDGNGADHIARRRGGICVARASSRSDCPLWGVARCGCQDSALDRAVNADMIDSSRDHPSALPLLRCTPTPPRLRTGRTGRFILSSLVIRFRCATSRASFLNTSGSRFEH